MKSLAFINRKTLHNATKDYFKINHNYVSFEFQKHQKKKKIRGDVTLKKQLPAKSHTKKLKITKISNPHRQLFLAIILNHLAINNNMFITFILISDLSKVLK